MFLFLLLATVSGCKDKAVTPTDELTATIQTAHFIFHYTPGDQIDTARQEAYYNWVVPTLGVSVPQKLECFRYHDRAQLARMTGKQTNGFAEPGTYKYHTIWEWDNHESTHCLVSSLIGLPPALFTEGFAVSLQTDPLSNRLVPMWNMTKLHTLAKQYLQAGSIPSLDALLESVSFHNNFDANITYPVSGSYCQYLVDTKGMVLMKSFMARSSYYDSIAQTKANFLAVYSVTLDSNWQEWLAYLPTQ